MRDTVAKGFVVFVAVFAVVFFGSILVGLSPGDDGSGASEAPEVAEIENEQYDLQQYDIDETPGQASVQMDSTEANRTVVIHAGRGVTQRQLQPLANALTTNGHELRVLSEGPEAFSGIGVGAPVRRAPQPQPSGDEVSVTGELEGAHALLSIGVERYNDDELQAISEFAAADGRIAVLTDPQDSFNPDAGATELQSTLDVFSQAGYVYNLQENDLNYQRIFAETRDPDSLTDGVDRAVFDTATPVGTGDGTELLGPIDGSKLSTTRAGTDAPVLVRDGNAVLAGDTDFISPENALRADNDKLIGNLADFLVTGDRTPADEGSQSEEIDGDVEAVTTEGLLAINADSEQQARRAGFPIGEGSLRITAALDGSTWESTEIETTSLGGPDANTPVELTAPEGLSGEIDIENDQLTVEGTLVLQTAEAPIEFDIEATTGESGQLTGRAELDADGGSATVVDNTFTVGSTGNAAIDDALDLPVEESGRNWLDVSFDLTFAPDAVDGGSDSGTDGGSDSAASGSGTDETNR